MENALYYGDNLDILRRYVANESVDLVYLDPPFKSNQDYNILFAEKDASRAASQIKAFEDTWHWDQGAEAAYLEVVEQGGKVSEALQAFRQLLGNNDMMAYIAMMAPRLEELHRVLSKRGQWEWRGCCHECTGGGSEIRCAPPRGPVVCTPCSSARNDTRLVVSVQLL
jgi:DNA modification methylase